MTRLAFGGAEFQARTPELLTVTGTVNIDTTGPRSGSGCFEFPSAAANYLVYAHTSVTNRWFYGRAWIYFSANPSVNTDVAAWATSVAFKETVTLRTDGKFVAPDGTIAAAASSPGYHCVEIGLKFVSTTEWHSICRINGVQLGGERNHDPSTVNPPTRFSFGNVSGVAHAITLRADDWAVNDDQGAAQNSWPGIAEKILLAKPASDNAVGSDWKLGDNTAPSSNAYDSVNNVPPAGVANTGAAAGAQIRDAVGSLTTPAANADFNCQDYVTAGAPSGSTITVTQAIAAVAVAANTVARDMGVKIVSNPSGEAEITLSPSVAAATYPTGWIIGRGNITHAPSVTLGTAPVLRVGKRNTSTSIVMCCLAAIQFGYEPTAVTTVVLGQATETDTSQAVARLKSRTLTQATEADAAQSVARLKARSLTQASETDTAQFVARTKARIVGQAVEADVAGAITRLKTQALGQATETDVAQPITRLKVGALGQAVETDTTQGVTALKGRVLGQAGELDEAPAITGAKLLLLGTPVELDIAQAVTVTKSVTLGQALEIDSAQPVTGSKALLLGQAEEIDLAQAITVIAAFALSADGYTDAVVGILTVAPTTGIFTSPANRN